MILCKHCGKEFDETKTRSGKGHLTTPVVFCSRVCKQIHGSRSHIRKPYEMGKRCHYCKAIIPNWRKYCYEDECVKRGAREMGTQRKRDRREHYRAKANNCHMIRRMKMFLIIGGACPKHPEQVPEIDHIAETGYWSGREHRARVNGTNGIITDLFRLHEAGVDIKKIVQPLCRSCNMTKYFQHRKIQEKASEQKTPE